MHTLERQIVGIAGDAGSGKDSVGNILQGAFGFDHISCSDLLRSYITDNRLGAVDRPNMTRVGRELRETKGASFLVEHCLNSYIGDHDLALGSIYSPAEALKIQQSGGRVLVVACREARLRYERIINRGTPRDQISFEEFMAAGIAENSGGEDQQNVAGISDLADIVIYNEGTMDDLTVQLAETVAMIRQGAYGKTH